MQTKLYKPPLRPLFVLRPHLIEKLNAGLNGKLTLVSAPAGFGKTTLVTYWLSQAERPFTWVSLDEDDNDLARFFTYAAAAVQQFEGVGNTIQGLLQSPQPASWKSMATAFINDCTSVTTPFILTLDDYHTITETAGAKLVIVASVYPYGKEDRPMTEDMPNKPEAPSGEYHAQAADVVMQAHDNGRIQATIGRASNYFGPHACRMWPGIDFKVAIAAEKMQIIGKKEPLHTYTYVYDFADGLITQGERDEALGEIWHIPSAQTITTQDFLDMLYAEAGSEPDVQVGPKPILTIMSWFNADMRPALEVFYQFDRPFIIDHSKYEKAFGANTTSYKEAIAQTVSWAKEDLA